MFRNDSDFYLLEIVRSAIYRQIKGALMSLSIDGGLLDAGGADAHMVTEHLVKNGVPVILTAVLTSPNRDWEGYDARYELPAKLFSAGVRFAIGGTSSAPYLHRLPYEAGAAIAYGLPADEALNAVTRYPAEILGLDEYIGTLEAGKRATFLITDSHPLEYSTNVEQVYVDGRESNMMDMHRQLYEKYKIKKERMQDSAD